jgi:hypothetical protein
MAPVSNFAFHGAARKMNSSPGLPTGVASFSWKPPSGAWLYQINITQTGYLESGTFGPYDFDGKALLNAGLGTVELYTFLTPGVTYTATISYSTVTPFGAPVFGNPTSITFSIPANTVQIAFIANYIAEPRETLDFLLGLPVAATGQSGSATLTGPGGYSQTKTTIFDGTTNNEFAFAGLSVPGGLYTLTATVAGVTTGTLAVYAPMYPNEFLTPTVGVNSIIFPWLDGRNDQAAAFPFVTCMLYNLTNDTWVDIKTVARGVQTVTFTGLNSNTQYKLYNWPLNSSGFGGSLAGGDHAITFVTGGVSTNASFGINGWFYSPVSN